MKEKLPVLKCYINGLSFYTVLIIGFIVVGTTSAYAAGSWSVESADGGIRKALGTVLFIIAAVLAIKSFAKGRKGAAVAEILIGAFLGIFVASSDPMESISNFFKGVIGL